MTVGSSCFSFGTCRAKRNKTQIAGSILASIGWVVLWGCMTTYTCDTFHPARLSPLLTRSSYSPGGIFAKAELSSRVGLAGRYSPL